MSQTPRMTVQEWGEYQRRMRMSKTQIERVRSTEAAGRTCSMTAPNQSLGRSALPAPERSASSPHFQSFFVPGRLPGANDIIRKHHMVYSRFKSEWGLTIARCIIVSKLKRVGYCRIEFVWHEPNDKRDDDNVMFAQKFVLDALRDTKIIQDDRRQFVYSLTHRVIVDPDQPGVEVTVIPICVPVAP